MLPRIAIRRAREHMYRSLSLQTKIRRYSDFARQSFRPTGALRERGLLLTKEARQLIKDAEAISSADVSAKTTAQLATELLTIVETWHKEIELSYFEAWQLIKATRQNDKVRAKLQAEEADTDRFYDNRSSRQPGFILPRIFYTTKDYEDFIQLINDLPLNSPTTLLGRKIYERDSTRWASPTGVMMLLTQLTFHGRSINEPGNKHTTLQSDREYFNAIITALRYRIDFVCTENYGGIDNLSLVPNSNGHYALNLHFTPAEDDVLREVVIKSIMRPCNIVSLLGAKSKASVHAKVKVNGLSPTQLYRAVHHILNKRYPRGYLFGIQRTIVQIKARYRKRFSASAWRTMNDQFIEIKRQGLLAHHHEEWLNGTYKEAEQAALKKQNADHRARKQRSTSSIDK